MIAIRTSSEFEPVLCEPRSAVFIHGEWSEPSVRSLEHLEAWLSSLDRRFVTANANVYCAYVPVGTHEYLAKWIAQNPLLEIRNAAGKPVHLGCRGTLAWVVEGHVVKSVSAVSKPSFDELTALTLHAFGNA